MQRWTVVSLTLASLMALGADDGPQGAIQEQLQGTWVSIKAFKPDGEELSPESIKEQNHRLIISGVCRDCVRAKRRARHQMNMI